MSRNFEDFDEKNIEIAKMLINDSEKITIDEKTNEKIIKSIRNGRKKKFTEFIKWQQQWRHVLSLWQE